MSTQLISINAAEHPVNSVVVLKSSKAEVVRVFGVALQSGQNKLVISKLPSTIDTQSVRISGLNSDGSKNGTYLSDVVCSESEASEDASTTIIRTLELRKGTLAHEKKVLDTQADVLVRYANSLSGEHASPDVMNNFLSSFVEHGKSNIRAIAELNAEIESIDKQIKAEKKKASVVKGTANTELTAVITAGDDANIELKLTYIVSDTNWSPTYELHAVTGDDGQPSRTVSLHYRASITQFTGEDWTDAALTLSTVATDEIVKRIPKLESVKLYVGNPNRFHSGGGFGQSKGIFGNTNNATGLFGNTTNTTSLFGSSTGAQRQTGAAFTQTLPFQSAPAASVATNVFGNAAPAPSTNVFASAAPAAFGQSAPAPSSPVIEPIDFESAVDEAGPSDLSDVPAKLVTQTPMALTYSVRGTSSIPSDGKEHIVTISVLSFETDVEYVSIPRVDPRVYLQCQVKNNSDYRLLPGPVSIILDDSYVSKSTISDVNRNDVFNFTLGDDPSVLISYSRLSKVEKEGQGSFADTVNITTYTASITVRNKHTFSIEKLILQDAIPISNDSRARVVLRQPKELISAKEGVLIKVELPKKDGTFGCIEPKVEADEEEDDDEGLKVKWVKEKEGLYEYRWRVDPDDKIKLQTVFETKASTDLWCFPTDSKFGQK